MHSKQIYKYICVCVSVSPSQPCLLISMYTHDIHIHTWRTKKHCWLHPYPGVVSQASQYSMIAQVKQHWRIMGKWCPSVPSELYYEGLGAKSKNLRLYRKKHFHSKLCDVMIFPWPRQQNHMHIHRGYSLLCYLSLNDPRLIRQFNTRSTVCARTKQTQRPQ